MLGMNSTFWEKQKYNYKKGTQNQCDQCSSRTRYTADHWEWGVMFQGEVE